MKIRRYLADYFHTIWLDNLFTSTQLLSQLDDEGFEAAGTVRTTIIRREDLEAKDSTKISDDRRDANKCDFLRCYQYYNSTNTV